MARDLRAELEHFDGSFPKPLKLEANDVFVGQVLRYESGHTSYGECPIVVLVDEATGEEWSLWMFHQVLRNEFLEKRKPRVGERVGIKRLPEDPTKAYTRYVVRVDRDAPQGGDPGAPPDPARFAPASDAGAFGDADAPASAPPAQRPFEVRAAEEDLKVAVREAGGTTLALAKAILSRHLPITDFTDPEGHLDFSALSMSQIHVVANRIRASLRAQAPPEADEPPPLSDEETPF